MADVMAFRLVGRFNSTRKMLPTSSVTISSIVDVLVLGELTRRSSFRAAPDASRRSVKPSRVYPLLLLERDCAANDYCHIEWDDRRWNGCASSSLA
jgi:hypothetical protein